MVSACLVCELIPRIVRRQATSFNSRRRSGVPKLCFGSASRACALQRVIGPSFNSLRQYTCPDTNYSDHLNSDICCSSLIPKTPQHMIIDHSDCLHKGINNRRPYKFKAAFFQTLGHGIRFFARHA